jgi:SAM-dependent methyltransferase
VDDAAERPFYDEYAWAYDLLTRPPADEQLDFIAGAFARRGAGAGAFVLDAGCGAGAYALGLARRGYAVEGVDRSPGLIAEARRRAEAARASGGQSLEVSFEVGDILNLTAAGRYDGLLCRGVLNDLLDGRSRDAAFGSFAGALRSGGALVLDVREWEATARRKIREPVFERTAETPRGSLTFRSVTRVDPGTRRLLVEERHTLRGGGGEKASAYDFQMRCWTPEELSARLARAGFGGLEFYGGYDRGTPAGAADRLVCVATRSGSDKLM